MRGDTAVTTTAQYKEWLASGQSDKQIVETIDVYHKSWGHVRLCNSDRNFRAKLDDGTSSTTYTAARFHFEPPEVTDTLGQNTTLVVGALDGLLYDQIQQMSFEDRRLPVTVTYRVYLKVSDSNPLITPSPEWTVHVVEATREVVRADLRAEQLRTQRIGLYYTVNEFPALAEL